MTSAPGDLSKGSGFHHQEVMSNGTVLSGRYKLGVGIRVTSWSSGIMVDWKEDMLP
jgi:hypothetical protein